jgi:hypothetical protein
MQNSAKLAMSSLLLAYYSQSSTAMDEMANSISHVPRLESTFALLKESRRLPLLDVEMLFLNGPLVEFLRLALYAPLFEYLLNSSSALNETAMVLAGDPLHASLIGELNESISSAKVLLSKVLLSFDIRSLLLCIVKGNREI